MKKSRFAQILIFFTACLFLTHNILAQSGNLTGRILDQTDDSPLWGTNILIAGTSIGAASDQDGKYRLTKIPVGPQIVVFRYLGYRSDSIEVEIFENRTLELDHTMSPQLVEGEEVLVTAQLQGQAAAINQQLTSNTIVNIVSADKIQELPDQNAAESVGRLPGVSIERDAGEGTKIIVRGLAPKFNSITINGERLPSTDAEDRSVDLSMISSDMLEGIEVFKALTPDKDADAVGGSINFVVRKAPKGMTGNVRFMGGYNDHENDYGNYKGNLSISNRFFDDKLGVLATGNLQEANRSSDLLDVSYNFERESRGDEERGIISVNNLNLGDRLETRNRYGGSISLDYQLENGQLSLSSLYGKTDREEIRRRKRYRVGASYVEYWLRNRKIFTDLYTNSLSGLHNFDFLKVDWRASYSLTKRNMPSSHDSQFRELSAFNNDLIEDQGPLIIPLGAKNNLDETFFKQDFLDKEKTNDRDFTGQVDLTVPFRYGDSFSGNIKFGGKYKDKFRERDKSQMFTLAFEINDIGAANPDKFELTNEQKIRLSNFEDRDFDAGKFLNGQYDFPVGLDKEKLDQFIDEYWDHYISNGAADLEDYEAGEKIYAGYLMAELNIGQKLLILPGFRFESTTNDYKTIFGDILVDENGKTTLFEAEDTLGTRTYDEFLPMFHVRYKFTDWFDARIAVTKSLSRPNYFNLVPWERISHFEATVERGDPSIKHTKVWNYDLFLSFYSNLGLLTLGGFYKTLDDIDYIRTARIQESGPTTGYQLTSPENSEGETTVKGFEIDIQTNLRFLPSPFDGILINANYTFIESETFFPFLEEGPRSTVFPFGATFIDSSRSGRMPGQSDHIANISIGYEKGDFTGRVSMIYQGSLLQTIGTREELDGFTDDFVRWDFIAQYKFIKNFKLIFNINNFSDRPEKAFLGIESFSSREEFFGWTADLGIKYSF